MHIGFRDKSVNWPSMTEAMSACGAIHKHLVHTNSLAKTLANPGQPWPALPFHRTPHD